MSDGSQQSTKEKQFKYRFRYSDGTTKEYEFDTAKEMEWYMHNEGDHLLEVTLLKGRTK
jgi:hypothetical protein